MSTDNLMKLVVESEPVAEFLQKEKDKRAKLKADCERLLEEDAKKFQDADVTFKKVEKKLRKEIDVYKSELTQAREVMVALRL